MNPNATTFCPKLRRSTAGTRSYQIMLLSEHIMAVQQEQHSENVTLHALHYRVQSLYQTLHSQTERSRRKEAGCWTNRKISEQMALYQTMLAEYTAQNTKVIDIAANLMKLNQRLHKLRLSEEAAMTPQSAMPHSSGSTKSATAKNLFSGKICTTKLDGIEKRSLSVHDRLDVVLPAIMESEADSVDWDGFPDFDDDGADGACSEKRTCCDGLGDDDDDDDAETARSVSPHEIAEIDDNRSESPCDSLHTLSSAYSTEQSLSPTISSAMSSTASSRSNSPTVSAAKSTKTEAPAPAPDTVELPGNEELEEAEDVLLDVMMESPDIDRVQRALDRILKTAEFGNKEAIAAAVEELCWAQGGSVSAINMMVNMVIDEALLCPSRVPTICAKHYAAMLWAINNYCKAVRHRQFEGRQWQWGSENLHQIKKVDIFKTLWLRLKLSFREAQVGSDPHRFVNVMVLTAELYNSRLLLCSKMLELMECVLGDHVVDRVGENDVDGLYQIFKRCSERFQKSKFYDDIAYYLDVLDKVKHWKKFKNSATRFPSVSFMIDEMHRRFYDYSW